MSPSLPGVPEYSQPCGLLWKQKETGNKQIVTGVQPLKAGGYLLGTTRFRGSGHVVTCCGSGKSQLDERLRGKAVCLPGAALALSSGPGLEQHLVRLEGIGLRGSGLLLLLLSQQAMRALDFLCFLAF